MLIGEIVNREKVAQKVIVSLLVGVARLAGRHRDQVAGTWWEEDTSRDDMLALRG